MLNDTSSSRPDPDNNDSAVPRTSMEAPQPRRRVVTQLAGLGELQLQPHAVCFCMRMQMWSSVRAVVQAIGRARFEFNFGRRKGETAPVHPQAPGALASARAQGGIRIRQHSTTVPWAPPHGPPRAGECQWPSGLAVVFLGAASCSGRHANARGCMGTRVFGRLLAIFWHKHPPEITRFPWGRPAALVLACGRASWLHRAGAKLRRRKH
jgi:hypothetical protein